MKITIEYGDGLPFASHTIAAKHAAAWRALFADTASKTTKFEGTAGDMRAREFAGDLVNATRAAQMDLSGGRRSDMADDSRVGNLDFHARSAGGEPISSPEQDLDPSASRGEALKSIGPAIDQIHAATESARTHARSHAQRLSTKPSSSSWRLLRRLARGHFGLARTYWAFGFGGLLVQGILLALAANDGKLTVAVGMLSLFYAVLLSVGIWRAANRYEGKTIWTWLAKATVVLAILLVIPVLAVAIWVGS